MVGAAFSGWFKLVDGAGPSMVQVLLSLQWLLLRLLSLQWLVLLLRLLSLQWLVLVNQPSVVVAQAAGPSVVGDTYSTQYNHALHP